MSEWSRPISEDDLNALVDGRLAPERRPAVEYYLARNPDAAARVKVYAAQRELLRVALRPKLDQPIPARLRIENLIEARERRGVRWSALAASVVAALALGGAGGWWVREAAGDGGGPLAPVAVTAHKVFVADGRRPVEIRADAQDQLVQWLSNRMQTPVGVPDLSSLGLRFMGGRLLPTPAGPAAQLMYDDDAGGRVTLFIEANASGADRQDQFARLDHVQALSWTDRRLAYTVTAARGRDQLAQLSELVRRQLPSQG